MWTNIANGESGASVRSKINALGGVVREKRNADLTIYVRKDGNDSNDGFSNGAGGAKLTIGAAMLSASQLDFNSKAVKVKLASSGIWDEKVLVPTVVGLKNTEDFYLEGDTTTPGNTIIRNTNGYAPAIEVLGTRIKVGYVRVTAPNNGYGINPAESGVVNIADGLEFGDCTGGFHIYANNCGIVNKFQPYKIVGPATAHAAAIFSGAIYLGAGAVDGGSLALAFTAFALAENGGTIFANGVTFTNCGSFTGKRYQQNSGGSIQTYGNPNIFPGNAAGTTGTTMVA